MEGCSEIIGYEDLDAHAKECFEQVVTCDHCEEEIIRAKLSEHQVRPMECKFKLVNRVFHENGQKFVSPRTAYFLQKKLRFLEK